METTGLWIGKLNESNAWYHIFPAAMSKFNKHLHIVRHKKLSDEIPNTTYHLYNSNIKVFDFIKLFFAGLKVIRKYKIDYIITFSAFPWGTVGWLLARITGKPIYMGFIGADYNKSFLNSWYKSFVKHMAKTSAAISVTGDHMKKGMLENGVNKEKIFTFPHCVRDRYFEHPINDEFTYDLITASSMIPRKQIHIILEAIALLVNKSINLNLIIIGDGPLLNELKDLSKKLKIQDHVTFTGYVDDVFSYLTKSKIYLQSSKSEGLSLSVIESIVATCVPVVSIAGSEEDIIAHKHNGILIADITAQKLADSIEYLLLDDNYEKIRKNVIKSRNRYRIESAISTIENIQQFIKSSY